MSHKPKQPKLAYLTRPETGQNAPRRLSARNLKKVKAPLPAKVKSALKDQEEKRIQEAIAQQDRRDEIERTTGKPSRFGYNPALVRPELIEEMEPRMTDVGFTKVEHEVVRRRPPSQQPGYARKNREGMVGLGVEIPIKLRDELQKVLDLDPKKTKQGFVIELLEAVVKEYKAGEPIQIPEKFKKDADSIRRAVALMVASLK